MFVSQKLRSMLYGARKISALALGATLLGVPMSVVAAQMEDHKFSAFVNPAPKIAPQYIVKFNDVAGLTPQASFRAQGVRQAQQLAAANARVIKRLEHINAMAVSVDASQLATLRAQPDVAYVERDPERRLLAQATPWGISAVEADGVSDSDSGSRKVCIIDSGYDRTNPDLASNNHAGTNVSGTGNWYVPGGSHGTHVAGTIAAYNNSQGVLGVMPSGLIAIHVVKVFNASGWGYASDLIDAIGVCQSAGAQVVNMSLGGSGSSTAERNAMQAYTDDGMLLIAAAGNDGNTAHSYPASYDSVVSVAAVDETYLQAEFSQATNQVELAAPGEAILSTVGRGDGVIGSITVSGSTYGDDRVVPHNRFISSGGSYVVQYNTGQVSGSLAACTVSGSGSYSCGNMSGKICLAERFGNQVGSSYPEIDAALACANAGAAGIIVYSNSARPGLQNPFLVDTNSQVSVPSVSVNRTLGQTLQSRIGQSVTLRADGNVDYAYYNGTSMATPHVAGVAALVWSYDTDCSPGEIRTLLRDTALDIDSQGRDNRTGYGLIQAASAVTALQQDGCTGGGGGTPGADLENGVPVTGLAGSAGSETVFTLAVPAGASNLNIAISGGSGDADLYVRYGSEPTTGTYDCRPYLNGNNEACPISSPQAGTYYVKLIGYTSYSGVTLVASYTTGGGGGGGPATFSNNSNYSIPDNNNGGITSPITSTRTGSAGTVSVDISIVHTYIGDLIVDVIAPNGTIVNVLNRQGGSADNINGTYQLNFGSAPASGEWKLKVRDRARYDTGYIDAWSITFP